MISNLRVARLHPWDRQVVAIKVMIFERGSMDFTQGQERCAMIVQQRHRKQPIPTGSGLLGPWLYLDVAKLSPNPCNFLQFLATYCKLRNL